MPIISHIADLPILSSGMEFTRWLHIWFGIIWIGLLYYFNFVQTEYFKLAEAGAKKDVLNKLAPNALWWFRYGALFTFLTGAILLYYLHPGWDLYIALGSTLGILMAANVWFVIWPKQKIVIAGKSGVAAAAARAGCASRTNTLFSIPMLLFMVSGAHLGGNGAQLVTEQCAAFVVALVVISLLELNALFGKPNYAYITSVSQVIAMGFVLTLALSLIVHYL